MSIPIYLVGPPGVGKTAVAKQAASGDEAACRTLGVRPIPRRLWYVPVPESDPLEVGGAHVVRDGVTVHAPSEMAVSAREEPCLVVLDDLTAAHRVQRVAALRSADPSTPHHPDTVVVAAGNPPEYAAGAGDPLTAPEISRYAVVPWGPEAAIRWLCAQRDETVREVGMFLRANPAAALATPEAMAQAVRAQRPFPTPRGWERAARSGWPIDRWDSLVGEGVDTYIHWRDAQDLPSPVEILAGRCKKVPRQGDRALAVATAVVGLLGESASAAAVQAAIGWMDAAGKKHAGILTCEMDRITERYPDTVRAAFQAGKLQPWRRMAQAVQETAKKAGAGDGDE